MRKITNTLLWVGLILAAILYHYNSNEAILIMLAALNVIANAEKDQTFLISIFILLIILTVVQ
jgi:hypothetical protein